MRIPFQYALVVLLMLFSCSDKYIQYQDRYIFKSADGSPDYNSLDYWAAHPWKKDPSDSVPGPLSFEIRDTVADVFFLHPTMFTKKQKVKKWNVDIDDAYNNGKTDYLSILYQASAFNQHARVFAPRYREAHLTAFYTKNKEAAAKAFDLAYEDIRSAFENYLAHYNNGRPIIIAAHSQGSLLALRLLKDFFDEKPLQRQLVAAYLLGWQIPKPLFTSLKACEDSIQTGCICGWRTLRRNYVPKYIRIETDSSIVTNPLTWKTDAGYAPKTLNNGSVLYNFNKIYRNTTDARIHGNVLWIRKPKFPKSNLYLTRNYHAGDINLFYINIRQNVEQRLSHFKTKTD